MLRFLENSEKLWYGFSPTEILSLSILSQYSTDHSQISSHLSYGRYQKSTVIRKFSRALTTHSSILSVMALFGVRWDIVPLKDDEIEASEGDSGSCRTKKEVALSTSAVHSSSLILASKVVSTELSLRFPASNHSAILSRMMNTRIPVGLHFGTRVLNLSLRVSQSEDTQNSLCKASQMGVVSTSQLLQADDTQRHLEESQALAKRWYCCVLNFICSSLSLLLP